MFALCFKVTPLPMECDPNGIDAIFQLGHIPIYVVATAGPYDEDDVDDINEFYHLILKINLNVKQNLTAELTVSQNTIFNCTITDNVFDFILVGRETPLAQKEPRTIKRKWGHSHQS